MITAKLNTYTKEEVEALEMIIDTAEEAFEDVYCTDVECSECKYRRICYDIHKLHEFMIHETDSLEHIYKPKGR